MFFFVLVLTAPRAAGHIAPGTILVQQQQHTSTPKTPSVTVVTSTATTPVLTPKSILTNRSHSNQAQSTPSFYQGELSYFNISPITILESQIIGGSV